MFRSAYCDSFMALPDASCMGRYDRTGVPRIIQSGSEGQTGFCYFLSCVEVVKVKITHAKRGSQKNPAITHGLPDKCPAPLCVIALFLFDHYFILKAHALLTGYYYKRQQQHYNHTTTTTSILQGQDNTTLHMRVVEMVMSSFWFRMKRSQRQGAGSGHFIQNYSKLDYIYSRVATSPANYIENPASSLWFVEYSNRLADTFSLFWFWMKQSQHQRQPFYSKF
jgi:hypothetical protein